MVALVAISSAVVGAYIANSPKLDRFPDSAAYESVADHPLGSFLSAGRLPGYPLVMAVSSWLPGGRDVALVTLQSLMVVAAVVLTYLVARAALGHAGMAFVVAFLVASDVLLAGFARIAMSETWAVLLTTAVALATVAFLNSGRAAYLWLMAGLMAALAFTRPEWAFLTLVLVPYVLAVMARRRNLDRNLLAQGAASIAVVLLTIGAYSLGNWIVNGYLGMSNISNIAILGKVMVYGMEGEAPPPYDRLAPQVESVGPALGPWPLMSMPPFNDANHKLAGDFGRAVILRDPTGFASHVFRTMITSSTEYDAVYLRVRDPGPFSTPLKTVLGIAERRYAAFILVPALATAWLVAGLLMPFGKHRAQSMGALSVVVLYGTVSAAAGTFDEFGRIHMPINAISTLIVVGTLLLNLVYAFRLRNGTSLLLLGLAAGELAAIILVPGWQSLRLTTFVLGAIGVLQLLALVYWSRVGEPTRREAELLA